MANNKSRNSRTTKTDRVLGLLTDPPAQGEGASHAKPSQETPPAASPRPDDKATQAQIRDALQEALLAELMPSANRVTEERAPDSVPFEALTGEPFEPYTPPKAEKKPINAPSSPPPEPKPEPKPAPSPKPEPKPEPAPSPKPIPEPVPEPEAHTNPEDHDFFYYNIAQSLVEAKAEHYMKLTGVCPCERCRRDVVALTLTNLPPKYVVTRSVDLIPRLSLYETRYSADISAQLMSACQKVAKFPHHNRG